MKRPAFLVVSGLLLALVTSFGLAACGGDERPGIEPFDAGSLPDTGPGPDVQKPEDIPQDIPEPDIVVPPAIVLVSPDDGSVVDLETPIRFDVNPNGQTVDNVAFYVWGTYPAHVDRDGNSVPTQEDWVFLDYAEATDEDGLYAVLLGAHNSKLEQYSVADGPCRVRGQVRMKTQPEEEWEEAVGDFVLDRSGPISFVAPASESIIDLETPIQIEVKPGDEELSQLFFFVMGTYAAHVDGDGNWVEETQDWVRLAIATEPGDDGLFTFQLADYEDKLQRYRVEDGRISLKGQARMKGQVAGQYREALEGFVLDRSGPEVELLNYPNDAATLQAVGELQLHFSVIDIAEVASVEVYVDGYFDSVIPAVPSGEYWVTLNRADYPDASEMSIVAVDGLGNQSVQIHGLSFIVAPPYRMGHPFDLGDSDAISALAVGHFDADGYPDLWVSTDDGLWLLLGTDSGSFKAGFKILEGQAASASHVFLDDFDDDGVDDILLLGAGSGGLSIDVALRRVSGDAYELDSFELVPGQVIEEAGEAVALADLDGDGLRDLVVAVSSNEDSLAVLLRSTWGELPVDEEPTDVSQASADAGTTDVEAEPENPVGISESLFFDTPIFLRGVANVQDIEVADFNGDEAPDLLLGRSDARQVSCYLGMGDGTFLDAVDTFVTAASGSPASIHALRFLGDDEHLDLVVGTQGDYQLHFLMGHGDGTFELDKDSSEDLGATPTELVGSYFEPVGEDHELDHLLVLLPQFNSVRFFHEQSKPLEFGNAYSTGEEPKNLRVADMNADGFLDFVYFNSGTGRVMTALGSSLDCDLPREILVRIPTSADGDLGGPLPPVDLVADYINAGAASQTHDLLVIGTQARVPDDVDVLGPRPDQNFDAEPPAVENALLSPILVFRAGEQGPLGTNPIVSWLPPPFNATPIALALGEIDSGALDLVVATSERPGQFEEVSLDPDPEAEDPEMAIVLTPTVAVLRGTGDGHFEPYVLPDSAGMWLKPYYEGVGFTPLPADVSPPFTLETVAAVERSQIVTQLLPVSLDSHAAMDLLILSPHPSCDCDANASLWAGNYSGGVGYFDGPIGDWHPLGWDPAYATMADMGPAADGLDDLIVTHSADQNIAVLHRTPNQPTFDEPTYYATPAEPRGIAGADMDGDGLPDLVIVVKDNVVIAWGKADDEPGPGGFHQMAFVRPVGGPDGSYPGSDPQVVLTDDFNYDGSLDLIVSNRSSDTLSLFFGSGDRLFPGQIEAPTGRGPQKLIRARFNGDSCTDYAVLNPSGMTVTLFLSNPADCPVGGGQ